VLRLVVSNQRGGVSKTTTTATLSRIFADLGMRVLAVDADPQGSLGLVLGLRPARYFYDFVVRNCPLGDCVVTAAPNLDVLCGSRDTAKVEVTLATIAEREFVLSGLLSAAEAAYDAVLIDVRDGAIADRGIRGGGPAAGSAAGHGGQKVQPYGVCFEGAGGDVGKVRRSPSARHPHGRYGAAGRARQEVFGGLRRRLPGDGR
jgi:hypothetical protein